MYLFVFIEREREKERERERCLQYNYLKTLGEIEIWSYRAISTVPVVFSTLSENSPPFSSSKNCCVQNLKYDARHIVYRCYSSTHFFQLFHVMMPFNNILLRAKFKKTHEYQSLSTKHSHCANHRMMKTENYVMLPFDSISFRTKFKGKKKIMNIYHFKPKAKSLTVPNMKW